jgi:hypothetical protein
VLQIDAGRVTWSQAHISIIGGSKDIKPLQGNLRLIRGMSCHAKEKRKAVENANRDQDGESEYGKTTKKVQTV